MMVVQGIMVKEIDQEREGSGQERASYVRKLITQGLMVERYLKERGIKDLIDGSPKGSTAQETSVKEPKAQQLRGSVKKPKAQPTASKQIGLAEISALSDDAEQPSSPSEEVSDTVPPSAPIEPEEPTEDLLEAVLNQVEEHICPNPFGDCPECEAS